MHTNRKAVIVVALAAILAAGRAAAQTRPPSPRPARAPLSSDATEGRKVFDAQCAWCHGNEGEGGMGPNLRGKLRHASSVGAIAEIVANGIPGTDMPGFRSPLTERSIRQTAAYVQSLSRSTSTAARGNPQHGASLYQSTGCAACHIVEGAGGILGPDLSAIGSRRGPAYLRDALVKPGAAHPAGYLLVRAVPASGPEVRGIRVNEDVFWVHIRDASGTVHTLEKSALKDLVREPDASLMPSYASRLKEPELDDLVAYLSSLRGAK